MSDLYDNLLKATDNTNDITNEKYGTVTRIDGTLCSVKEYDSELEHSNVPIVNGAKLEIGDKVIIGFLNNSIYDTVCYGVLDRQIETNWEDIKDKPTTFPTNWENIEDKPTTFPPTQHNHISSEITDLINTIYPVGSIYMSVNSVNPSTLFGGTWEQIQDKFLLASGTSYSNGATGGSATVTLTEDQMPSHTHTQQSHSHTNIDGNFVTSTQSSANNTRVTYSSSGNRMVDGFNTTNSIFHHRPTTSGTTAINNETGGGQAHENMPPYLAVNVWKRTA